MYIYIYVIYIILLSLYNIIDIYIYNQCSKPQFDCTYTPSLLLRWCPSHSPQPFSPDAQLWDQATPRQVHNWSLTPRGGHPVVPTLLSQGWSEKGIRNPGILRIPWSDRFTVLTRSRLFFSLSPPSRAIAVYNSAAKGGGRHLRFFEIPSSPQNAQLSNKDVRMLTAGIPDVPWSRHSLWGMVIYPIWMQTTFA